MHIINNSKIKNFIRVIQPKCSPLTSSRVNLIQTIKPLLANERYYISITRTMLPQKQSIIMEEEEDERVELIEFTTG